MARRDAGLAVSDRITVTVDADGEVARAVRTHSAFVGAETLAESVTVDAVDGGFEGEAGDGVTVRVRVRKI
jgi:isoleucyl-tRNA synthetase